MAITGHFVSEYPKGKSRRGVSLRKDGDLTSRKIIKVVERGQDPTTSDNPEFKGIFLLKIFNHKEAPTNVIYLMRKTRDIERSTPTIIDIRRERDIKSPLTQDEIKYLEDKVLNKCTNAFVAKAIRSGLSGFLDKETKSIKNYAYLYFRMIAEDCFDKSLLGPIGNENIEGVNSPKTLDWYFYTFFTKKINELAKELKKANAKNNTIVASTDIVEFSGSDKDTLVDMDFRKMKDLLIKEAEERGLSQGAQNLLYEKYVLGMKIRELILENDDYYRNRNELQNFIYVFILKYRKMAAEIFGVDEEIFYARVKNAQENSSMLKMLLLLDRSRDMDVAEYIRNKEGCFEHSVDQIFELIKNDKNFLKRMAQRNPRKRSAA